MTVAEMGGRAFVLSTISITPYVVWFWFAVTVWNVINWIVAQMIARLLGAL